MVFPHITHCLVAEADVVEVQGLCGLLSVVECPVVEGFLTATVEDVDLAYCIPKDVGETEYDSETVEVCHGLTGVRLAGAAGIGVFTGELDIDVGSCGIERSPVPGTCIACVPAVVGTCGRYGINVLAAYFPVIGVVAEGLDTDDTGSVVETGKGDEHTAAAIGLDEVIVRVGLESLVAIFGLDFGTVPLEAAFNLCVHTLVQRTVSRPGYLEHVDVFGRTVDGLHGYHHLIEGIIGDVIHPLAGERDEASPFRTVGFVLDSEGLFGADILHVDIHLLENLGVDVSGDLEVRYLVCVGHESES